MTDPMTDPTPSLTDAWQAMRADEAFANARLHDRQTALGPGDHFVRFFDVPAQVLIFARADTEAETIEAERALGATVMEIRDLVTRIRTRIERHYLYGRHYSLIEPDGELGTTHASLAWPISEITYTQAKAARWTLSQMPVETQMALSIAYAQWIEHQRWLSAQTARNGG